MKTTMTSRERVKAAIEFTGPDRLPHRHSFVPAVFETYPKLEELYKQYPSDFAGENGCNYESVYYKKGQFTDEWGCVWTAVRDGYLGQVTEHPLMDLSSLKDYTWPKADLIDISGYVDLAKNRGDRYLRLGWLTLYERMIDLRGFENLMVDIVSGEKEFFEIRDNVLKFNLDMIDRLLEFDPDGIMLADDWGSQISLMISPTAWRELYLPVYKKMFERIREAGKHVFFHTDGYTIDILPDLVDAGVNVFWVDLTVNGIDALRERLGGKVCFQGLTDIQFTLVNGTTTEVEKHGKDLIKAFGTFNGGFIACSELEPDQPWENIKTILETFHRYGKYPLQLD